MKQKRFFFAALLLLGAGVFIESQDFVYARSIQSSYTISKRSEIWNQPIADSINQKNIYLTIDGKSIELAKGKIYMNENLNLMIPASILTETFNCSARLYDNRTLVIEQNDIAVRLTVNEYLMEVNGKICEITSPLIERKEGLYLAAETLEQALGCQYGWDMNTNSAVINIASDSKRLPAFYDYRKTFRDPLVKDQGRFGTCWAFASLTALESALLPEEEYDFSEDHMSLRNSFTSNQNDGGEYTMAMAYLASWQGPVLEADDPYGDGYSPSHLEAVKHVQEIQVIGAKNFEKIKEMVFKYGGVQTSLYTSLKNSQSRSEFYNSDTYAYCYIGTEKPNHDVVIIGWDDNYPKENFTMNLEADGAFICRNSWGEAFGEHGTFYVSYYDTNIGVHNVVITSIEDVGNYDTIYQADLCGWVGQLGYGKDRGYFANVYTANENEWLSAVSFYATGKDTEYEIYVVHDFEDAQSLNNRQLLTGGMFENGGYYTVPLSQAVFLDKGERFAVVVKIITPNAERPIAIEYAADEATEGVDLSDGEGYISLYGKAWESAENTQNCNVCLKTFTKKIRN